MNATETIRESLMGIMDGGELNACRIYKGWAYDGTGQRYGWYYQQFNASPTYLGKSLAEALAMIEQIADSRESE